MKDPWYTTWANKDEEPSEKDLKAWTLSRWLRAKARDLTKALADVNMTLSIIGGKDEAIQKCGYIEREIMRYLTSTFPVDIPVLVDYQPKMVDKQWVTGRLADLNSQLETFSTLAYWSRLPAEQTKQANQAANLCNTAIYRYEQLTAQDWRGVIDALQEYVTGLEYTQIVLGITRNEQGFDNGQWSGSAAALAKKTRAELRAIHRTLVEDTRLKFPTLQVRPWNIDEGLEFMTWSEFQEMPFDHWEEDVHSGPPKITDGPLYEKGKTISFDDLLIERREQLDRMLEEFNASRFGVVKGFIRRERKMWGKRQISIAQYKRWLIWPGSLEEKVAESEEIIGD